MKKLLLSMFVLGASVTLRAQNPYPILPIDSVQFVSDSKLMQNPPNDSSDYVNPIMRNVQYGDTVRVEGIVLMNPKLYGLSTNRKATYLMSETGGPWNGMEIMCEPVGTGSTLQNLLTETKFYDNLIRGYKVRVTGVLRQFNGTGVKFGETQLNMIRSNANFSNEVELVSLTPTTISPNVVNISDLMTGNTNASNRQIQKLTGEKWEGSYVELRNVVVTNNVPNGSTRWTWAVSDAAGNQINVYDVSGYFRNDHLEDTLPKITNVYTPPSIGTGLGYIRGVVVEATLAGISMYTIAPLSPSDIGTCNVCPPLIGNRSRNPVIATPSTPVTISATITGDTVISSAQLFYATNTGTSFTQVPMVLNGAIPNLWNATIPAKPADTIVKYYIRAYTAKGAVAYATDSLATNQAYLVTNGVNSIKTIQYTNSPASGATIWNGDSLLNIDVRGVVTAKNLIAGTTNLITVQAGTGPNSAVFIQKSNNGVIDGWQVGDSVSITRATVKENFNVTTLYNVLGNVISSGNPLPPFATGLSIDSFALNKVSYARKWEGVLVKWDSMVVANVNPDAPTSNNGEWSFAKDTLSARSLRADDMNIQFAGFNNKIKKGIKMGYIQGPMYFSFSNFKMAPRGLSDVDLSHIDTLPPVITLLGDNPDTVEVGSGAYADAGATATDNIDGDITANIIKSGTVNTALVGTYTLTYKVSDAWGNMDSAARTVVVKDTASVGINENEMNFAQLSIYPNPATDAITVSANFIKTQPVKVSVVDILGRELVNRTYTKTQFTDTVSLSNFNNGVYFCVISNATGKKTLKFIVNGK